MTHGKDIIPLLQVNANPYSTLIKGEREPIHICFGCKKCWNCSTKARKHYKEGENCKVLHRRFLEDIGCSVSNAQVNVRLQRENMDLRHQVERLTEDLLAENRMSKIKEYEEEIRYYKDYTLMIQMWLCPFIMERLTPDERTTLTNFWRIEHNPSGGIHPRSEVLKLLDDQLKESTFLQMMAVPTFHDYKLYRQLGHHLTTTLISGMAFFNISYVPPAYGPLPGRNQSATAKKNESNSPPSSAEATENEHTDDENDYYSDGD